MKLSADDATVILVGGGSIVHMDDLEGVSKIIRPQYAAQQQTPPPWAVLPDSQPVRD